MRSGAVRQQKTQPLRPKGNLGPGVPRAALSGRGAGRAPRLTVIPETWKVQLNVRVFNLSEQGGQIERWFDMCTIFF